jgi:hypothetical protein
VGIITFAGVNFQRILSCALICLVLLSSTDETILADLHGKIDVTNTQLAFSNCKSDLSHDFRESFKMTLSEEKDNTEFVHHQFIDTEFSSTAILRYDHYWQAHQTRKPSEKLFIDFRSMLI